MPRLLSDAKAEEFGSLAVALSEEALEMHYSPATTDIATLQTHVQACRRIIAKLEGLLEMRPE